MIDFCALSRESLRYWLSHGQKLVAKQRAGFRAGCFVSIHDSGGELRGCIGTIDPVRADIVDEVIENAISAGTRDPRFSIDSNSG